MKKVLFVTYGGGHVNIVKPIAKEIEKHNDIDYQILALTTAIPYLENTGLKYKTLLDYLPMFKNNEAIINLGNRLASQYHNSEAGFSIEQTSAYLGCSMYDLIEKVGEEKALKKFNAEGRRVFCPTSIMKQILKIEKPDIVVTTVPYRMEKAAVLEAQELGIKTVFIHDFSFIEQSSLFNIVDVHCVMNKFVKRQLVNCGIEESKIFVTGQPAFDYLLEPVNKNRDEICREFNLSTNKKIIVWIADNSNVLTATYFNEIAKVINKYKEYQFVIKMHPGEENVDKFKKYVKYYNENTVLLHRCNNKELIHIGDLFLVGVSTMGLEISRSGKNMICLDYDNLWENLFKDAAAKYRYDVLNLGLLVKTNDNLLNLISNMLNDSKLRKHFENKRTEIFPNKQRASLCCFNLLKII